MKTALVFLATNLLAPVTPDGGAKRVIIEGEALRCRTYTQRELQDRRRLHAFACLDLATGELRGAFLKPKGSVACEISGTVVGNCATVEACGEEVTECL